MHPEVLLAVKESGQNYTIHLLTAEIRQSTLPLQSSCFILVCQLGDFIDQQWEEGYGKLETKGLVFCLAGVLIGCDPVTNNGSLQKTVLGVCSESSL